MNEPARGNDGGGKSSWSQTSFEFKGFFIYHIGMMLMMIAPAVGVQLSILQEASVAIALMGAIVLASVARKRAIGWVWPGVGVRQIRAAAFQLAATAVFLFAATPLFPPSSPVSLPWYLAAAGIGVFNILNTLRWTSHDASPEAWEMGTPAEPIWRRALRMGFSALFFAVWLTFLTFFYFDGEAIRTASRIPTATQTEAISEKGRLYYITREQARRIDILKPISMIGIPLVIALGILLDRVIGLNWRRRGS